MFDMDCKLFRLIGVEISDMGVRVLISGNY